MVDRLTIRADRDRYYYGMDILFGRHDDTVQRLCLDAPALLWTLLDGLVWRSRVTEKGRRRVNYYIRHLLQDADGNLASTIKWVTECRCAGRGARGRRRADSESRPVPFYLPAPGT